MGKSVPPEGPTNPRLLILQDCPSPIELDQGCHILPGPAKTLKRVLNSAGIHTDEVRLEFLLPSPPANAKEARAQAKEVSPAFVDHIKTLRPQNIMILGGNAPFVTKSLGQLTLAALLGRSRCVWADYRQTIIPWNNGNTTINIFLTHHPTAVMRQPKIEECFRRDAARFKRWVDRKFTPPEGLNNREFLYPSTIQEIRNLLPTLCGNLVAFDVETTYDTGVIWEKRLTCWAVSDGQRTISIPYSRDMHGEHAYFLPNEERELIGLFKAFFREKTVITQNGPAFDHIVAESYGFPVHAWEDTCNLAHILHGHLPKALDFLSSFYLDIPPWKKVPHTTDMGAHRLYNCQDTLYTYLVYQELTKRMKEEE